MTEMACAISPSSASMTGAVAATAEPPQIDEPTPTRIAVLDGTFRILYSKNATMSDVAIVDRMIGSDVRPTLPTVARFSPKPSRTTALCRIFLDVNAMPL